MPSQREPGSASHPGPGGGALRGRARDPVPAGPRAADRREGQVAVPDEDPAANVAADPAANLAAEPPPPAGRTRTSGPAGARAPARARAPAAPLRRAPPARPGSPPRAATPARVLAWRRARERRTGPGRRSGQPGSCSRRVTFGRQPDPVGPTACGGCRQVTPVPAMLVTRRFRARSPVAPCGAAPRPRARPACPGGASCGCALGRLPPSDPCVRPTAAPPLVPHPPRQPDQE